MLCSNSLSSALARHKAANDLCTSELMYFRAIGWVASHEHTPQAPCTPRLPTQTILFCVLTRAQRNARTLQPAALAFGPIWVCISSSLSSN